MIEALLLLLGLALVAACGVFVAAEFAFVTADRPSVERAADGGDRGARGVLAALRTLSTQLSGAQLGITVTNLAIGFLTEPAVAQLLQGPMRALGVSGGAVDALSVTIAMILATAVTMVFGELVPKNLALAHPLAVARAVQGPQRAFTRAAGLLIRSLNVTANAVLHRLGVSPQEELASARSAQELFSLVGRSAEHGTLSRETATLVQRSLLFGDRTAEDVMTPRMRMRTVHADEPISEVITLTRRTGHSRFPVLGADSDDVVGVIHIKNAVGVPEDARERTPVRDIMVAPVTVPSTLLLDPLLEMLRSGGLQMAIVVDEFGGTDGLVTAEDLIEEIVGDVVDEHDRVSPRALRRRDGSWLLSGLLRPEEAGNITGISIPTDDTYQTLGGLVSRALGRVPRAGDATVVEAVRYTVERMDGRRVDRIRLDPTAPTGVATRADPRPAERASSPATGPRARNPRQSGDQPRDRAGTPREGDALGRVAGR
jgi:CBS domain containing-hemolysin-like protein